jgi:hypothetical protein
MNLRYFIKICVVFGVLGLLAGGLFAEEISSLPLYDVSKNTVDGDWLISPVKVRSGVYRTENANEIVLSNGLIKRVFRVKPNAATVAFENLVTGESIMRSVKPEAQVEIDGVMYDVGGLTGQPDNAFLRLEWIDDLKVDPDAFQFVGFEVGQPRNRMEWKKVRHFAPKSQWPPLGAYLRMDYRMPSTKAEGLDQVLLASDMGRQLLFSDEFTSLKSKWKIHRSRSHERSSFENEGKIGEISTPAHTAVYAERDLPEGTHLVEVGIDAGTDKSGSWGPGIALVWDKKVIKFNLRTGESSPDGKAMFGVFDGQKESLVSGTYGKLSISKPWLLRLRIGAQELYCEARTIDGKWNIYKTITLPGGIGAPKAVRIGKMDRKGASSDYSKKGDLVRLKISSFKAYSDIDLKALKKINIIDDTDRDIKVSVHYELYDGIPLFSKWITVHNKTKKNIRLNSFASEILAVVEYDSAGGQGMPVSPPNIHVVTDYCRDGGKDRGVSRFERYWTTDPQYKTQVNFTLKNPCMLKVKPYIGPDETIKSGDSFESFRTFILPYDSYDRERKGLSLRKMYRTISPWITENPLMMHARFTDWDRVKLAIDQCAEVGFEMVILTFWSGFDIENNSEEYIAKMKMYADYARDKGIEIGGYSLLASRRVAGDNNVVSPEGIRPTFGESPCLGSDWGKGYFDKLYTFFEKTGFMNFEHDGSYPGDVCASKNHPGHDGLNDSRWKQWRIISDFYKWSRARGIYLNVPDHYLLSGSNKTAMGYKETNWSLPRAQQVIHTRQNIFDGTWRYIPSMGWMFVPLTQYHGGGADATIEPLSEHLDHYERMLVSNLGAGVQACYRGPRLYDTDKTKKMVKKWVDWFKLHREVLEGDIIHLRRADGRDIDYWLNVNPFGKEKGLLMVYNPLQQEIRKTIKVPLYYTGLTDQARIREKNDTPQTYTLSRDFQVELPIQMAPESMTWFVIE